MPRSTCSQCVAVDRATSSATGPQKTFKPRRRFSGRRRLCVSLQQLNHQPIGALALPLEIRPVTRCRSFEPRDLRVQCHNLSRHGDVARFTTTCWSWRMPNLGQIHAHQRLAIIRK